MVSRRFAYRCEFIFFIMRNIISTGIKLALHLHDFLRGKVYLRLITFAPRPPGSFIQRHRISLIWISSYIPQYPLKERSFNVLVAPREHFHSHAQPQPQPIAIQSSLCHRQLFWYPQQASSKLEMRGGFITFQLMTILEGSRAYFK